ncbi:MAG: hypothetical protein ACEY3K_10525, partial [Wolbachia sp.]
MLETYPAGGTKNFIHGIDYQKLWLLLFLIRVCAVDKGCPFYLATEMRSAAGFDDIVFQDRQNGKTKFIQIKHKRDGHDKISVDDLLTQGKKSKFGLAKYFAAYFKTENSAEFSGGVKDFVVATNINFDF